MQVLVTGATGFIGRALIPLLQREGHSVVAWVRSEARARSLLGAEVEMVHADAGLDALVSAIERCDAVVNLAGEPLLGGRWTAARRAILESSRVEVTDLLVRAIAKARTRPGVLVSGSAVGYYGRPRGRATRRGVERRRRFPRAALPAVGERGAISRVAGRACGSAAHRGRPGSGRGRAGPDAAAVRAWTGRAARLRTAIPAVDSSPRSREDHRGGTGRRALSRSGERRGAGASDKPIVCARIWSAPSIAQRYFRCRRWRSE